MRQESTLLSTHPSAGGLALAGLLAVVIAATDGSLKRSQIPGSMVSFAYPWRLGEADQAARVSAWAGSLLHNLSAWVILATARRARLGFSDPLRPCNYWMLVAHLIFALLHVLQTQLWYDGLARDLPEISALGSVALMLMVILALETPRRGLILG